MMVRTCGNCCRTLRAEQPSFCSRACSNARGRKAAPIEVSGDVARIALPCGRTAVVDATDAELVKGQPWRVNSEGYVAYVRATPRVNGVRTSHWVFLHRLIAGTPPRLTTDHIDGDPLNNRRRNLRVVTNSQNAKNKHSVDPRKTSRFKGVHWYARGQKWAAAITTDYTKRHLGYFATQDEAARAYDAAARVSHGDFASLNFAE